MKLAKLALLLVLLQVYLHTANAEICWDDVSDQKICFSLYYSFLDQSYFQEQTETILEGLNNWIRLYNEGASKVEAMSTADNDRIIVMNKREAVKKEETLFKFHVDKTLNSNNFNLNVYKQNKMPANFDVLNKEAKLALGLLHHLYYIDNSPLKIWLRSLSFSYIPNFSIISTPLMNLLKGDQSFIDIQNIRSSIIQDYNQVKSILRELPEDTRNEILNFKEDISLNNWVYAYSVVLKQSVLIRDSLYLVPFANFAKYKVSIEDNEEFNEYQTLFEQTHIRTHDNSLYYLAPREIKFGLEVIDSFGKFGYINSLFIHNLKEENPSECFNVDLIDQETFDGFEADKKAILKEVDIEKNSICIINFLYSLKKLKVLANVLYMESQDAATCLKDLRKEKKTNLVDKIDYILGKCSSPLWDIKTPIEEEKVIKIVSKELEILKEKLNNLEELSNESGYDIVKYYLKKRVGLVTSVEKYIKELYTKQYKRSHPEEGLKNEL